MPFLTQLSFVKQQTRNPSNTIQVRRQELIARLTEQKEMVQSMIDEKPYIRYQAVRVSPLGLKEYVNVR